MTEQPGNSRIYDWLDETVGRTPDPIEGTQQVMSQIEETSQVGRWLPFQVFHRNATAKAKTPTATGTAEYQPTPIPASNGHAPTVTGRTQSMFSPVKAITAGALVFAIGGAFLIAQPFDQQSTAPGATVDVQPAWVTGTAEFSKGCSFGDLTSSENGVIHESFHCPGAAWTADDPRLTGNVREMWTLRGYRTESAGYKSVLTNRYIMDTEDGTWLCESMHVGSGTGKLAKGLELDTLTCVGDGAHAGLTAIVEVDWGEVGHPFEALVFSGEVAPAPDPSDFE